MAKFKSGDKVRCLAPEYYYLKYGETYTVKKVGPSKMSLEPKENSDMDYFLSDFELVEDTPKPKDAVNQPAHYTSGSIECIDYIQSSLSEEEFRGWLRGNIIKYQHRYRLKGKPAEDLKKIAFYLDRLQKLESKANA